VDSSLENFLFTLTNPHTVQARRFGFKAEKKDDAIVCHSERGPHLYGIDCNTRRDNYTSGFGFRYANDTGLDGTTFFTGSWYFQVKEIGVSQSQTTRPSHQIVLAWCSRIVSEIDFFHCFFRISS
jgi:hypothetical protein